MQIYGKKKVIVAGITLFNFTVRCRECGYEQVTVSLPEKKALDLCAWACPKCAMSAQVAAPKAEKSVAAQQTDKPKPVIQSPKPKMKVVPISHNQGRVIKNNRKHSKR